jgi:hypothetical protein
LCIRVKTQVLKGGVWNREGASLGIPEFYKWSIPHFSVEAALIILSEYLRIPLTPPPPQSGLVKHGRKLRSPGTPTKPSCL